MPVKGLPTWLAQPHLDQVPYDEGNDWTYRPHIVHRRDIPLLFVYSDGTPLDERRLDAFTFRLARGVRTPDSVRGGPRLWLR